MKKKIFSLMLVLALVFSFTAATFANSAPDEDSLLASMNYLVKECGPRFRGTPNETKAAQYVRDRFEEWGYEDIEWARPTMTSGNITAVNRMQMTKGPNVFGNVTASVSLADFSGKLVDLGTHTNYAVPAGVTGDIVGAVRFSAAPTAALINGIVAAVSANPDVNLKGLFFTRTDGTNWYRHPTAVANTDVPCFSSAQSSFENALSFADNEVELVERSVQYNQTNVVIAKKPATSGVTDLVIVVTAHMDSVIDSLGCNDNATGAAAVIELARRFANVDTGNIELWFATLGSEEGNSMRGAVYVAEQVIAEGKRDIAINMNMDMLGSSPNARTAAGTGGSLLNAVSMDINVNANSLTINLPAYLVTNFARDVEWAPGIDNVRIFNYGGSDHEQFHSRSIEAASMIIVTNGSDDIEHASHGYHSGADNMEQNYSFERHSTTTNLMANGLWKAIDQEITKRAKFAVNKDNGTFTLLNAQEIFNTWTSVTATIAGATRTFTPDNPVVTIANPSNYNITAVNARGTGIADNMDAARNTRLMNLTTPMAAAILDTTALDNAVAAYEARTPSDYTVASWNTAQDAYQNALPRYNIDAGTQDQADEAALDLMVAVGDLDKATLDFGAGQPAALTLKRGQVYQIKIGSNNKSEVLFFSANSNVTVSTSGLVTGTKPGIAIITVVDTWAGQFFSIVINVTN